MGISLFPVSQKSIPESLKLDYMDKGEWLMTYTVEYDPYVFIKELCASLL